MTGDSFSIPVIKRILTVLTEQGSTNRTGLANRAGLNYTACMRYLKFLSLLRWVNVSHGITGGIITLTDAGKEFKAIFDGSDELLAISKHNTVLQVR